MNVGSGRAGTFKKLASLGGLVASVVFLAALEAPPALLAAVAVLWLVFLLWLQRSSSDYVKVRFVDRLVTLALVIVGFVIGRLLPLDGLQFFPIGLGVALLVFLAFGVMEMFILSRVLPPTSGIALLNGARFSYFALGLALSIVLRSQG